MSELYEKLISNDQSFYIELEKILNKNFSSLEEGLREFSKVSYSAAQALNFRENGITPSFEELCDTAFRNSEYQYFEKNGGFVSASYDCLSYKTMGGISFSIKILENKKVVISIITSKYRTIYNNAIGFGWKIQDK